jgi:hypothetical protein
LLNKLALQKLLCPISLSEPFFNISVGLIWDSENSVFTYLSPAQSLHPTGRTIPARSYQTLLVQGEGVSVLASQGDDLQLHKGSQKGSETNMGALIIRFIRTLVQIQACFGRQRGV